MNHLQKIATGAAVAVAAGFGYVKLYDVLVDEAVESELEENSESVESNAEESHGATHEKNSKIVESSQKKNSVAVESKYKKIRGPY